MPGVLRRVGVGAREADPPVGDVGAGGPHLLAGEHATRLRRARPGSAATPGRDPAPGSLNSWHHVISPRRVGPTKRSRWSSVPCPRIVGAAQAPMRRSGPGDAGRGQLLVDDQLLDRVRPQPVRRGPVRCQEARSRRAPPAARRRAGRRCGEHARRTSVRAGRRRLRRGRRAAPAYAVRPGEGLQRVAASRVEPTRARSASARRR